jgi:hypothetical protein
VKATDYRRGRRERREECGQVESKKDNNKSNEVGSLLAQLASAFWRLDVCIGKESLGGTACWQAVLENLTERTNTGCKQPVPPVLLFLWQRKVQ